MYKSDKNLQRDHPHIVSLFSGCGGFDLGFQQQGFTCRAAFDNDILPVDVFRRNVDPCIELLDLSEASLKNRITYPVSVLLAGSPCQGFSTAGKRQVDDPRNRLLLSAGRLALEIKPQVFIAENVSGVIRGEHGKYWLYLKHILRSHGYKTANIRCQAHNLGVPQLRTRIIMLAWRTDVEPQLTFEHHCGGSLRDAICNIGSLPNHKPENLIMNSTLAQIAMRIRQGQKLCNVRSRSTAVHTWDIPNVYGDTSQDERMVLEALLLLRRRNRVRKFGDADPVSLDTLEGYLEIEAKPLLISLMEKGYVRLKDGLYDLTNTFNGKFRRLPWDKPSLTVDTRFGDPRYFLHPTEQRGFTVREAARVQGFPDQFIFHGPERAQYQMIGNAVPPPMASNIAKLVRSRLLKFG